MAEENKSELCSVFFRGLGTGARLRGSRMAFMASLKAVVESLSVEVEGASPAAAGVSVVSAWGSPGGEPVGEVGAGVGLP